MVLSRVERRSRLLFRRLPHMAASWRCRCFPSCHRSTLPSASLLSPRQCQPSPRSSLHWRGSVGSLASGLGSALGSIRFRQASEFDVELHCGLPAHR
jgi:hypothetical protein